MRLTTFRTLPSAIAVGIWIFNMATSNLQPGYTYTFRINLANGQGITFLITIK